MTIRTDRTPDSSSGNAIAVSPSDETNLPSQCRYLYVGGPGNLSFQSDTGAAVVLVGLLAGWHPIRATRVNATGTTATNIVVFF